MKKNEKTDFNQKLKKNEFNMICDILNGTLVNLEPLNWEDELIKDILCIENINSIERKWDVNSKVLMNKLEGFSALEKLVLLSKVDLFWGVDESNYETLNMISPENKILEITWSSNEFETLIWSPEASSIEDFFMVCKGLKMDYIIFVQDSEGNEKSIWGTTKNDLINCFFTFSEKDYFGRIKLIKDMNSIEF
jgi:hypothetical protein